MSSKGHPQFTESQAQAWLDAELARGREMAQTDERAPMGSYPRIVDGWIEECVECGAWSISYIVDNGQHSEERGYTTCACFRPQEGVA